MEALTRTLKDNIMFKIELKQDEYEVLTDRINDLQEIINTFKDVIFTPTPQSVVDTVLEASKNIKQSEDVCINITAMDLDHLDAIINSDIETLFIDGVNEEDISDYESTIRKLIRVSDKVHQQVNNIKE